MSVSFVCPSCRTAYRLPEHLAATRPLRVRCARCKKVSVVESGAALRPPPDDLPGAPPPGVLRDAGGVGRSKPGLPPEARTESPSPGGDYDLGPLPGGDYDLGPLPGGDHDLGPTLGDEPSARARTVRLGAGEMAGGRPEEAALDAPRPPDAGDGPGERPFRRPPPPAASGRRAFLTGLLGVAGMAAAGAVAVRAWRGRDWLAFLTGDPFEVRVTRRRALTGRAGRLYVVEGTIRNLSGSPKGFFEVRARLLDAAGQTLAERVVFAGQVLRDAELRGLPRSDLESRVAETVFGEGMANARVQPRRTVPFQVVFVEPPPAPRIADAAAEVVGVKDVP